jgi:tetratricopeptide (TPR) repeat protein
LSEKARTKAIETPLPFINDKTQVDNSFQTVEKTTVDEQKNIFSGNEYLTFEKFDTLNTSVEKPKTKTLSAGQGQGIKNKKVIFSSIVILFFLLLLLFVFKDKIGGGNGKTYENQADTSQVAQEDKGKSKVDAPALTKQESMYQIIAEQNRIDSISEKRRTDSLAQIVQAKTKQAEKETNAYNKLNSNPNYIACENFLATYPNSKYVSEVNSLKAKLDKDFQKAMQDAKASYELEDYENAKKYYRKALKIKPNNAEAKKQLQAIEALY